jgi:DMSO/TMAO reductase YedYZ molybdopterin-dependent catalytic subunit
MIALKINNVTLPPERSYPFQLVAENKWAYIWIKWITAIKISNNLEYQGYWEIIGYSNTENLDETFYG